MTDPFIGEIRAFAFNYAPVDWAMCNGQLISMPQHQALAAVIGVRYGGDGRTTIGLPNLQGRSAVGVGAGPGLTPFNLAAAGGQAAVTLSQPNIPTHNHIVNAAINPNAKTLSVATPAGALASSYLVMPTGAGIKSYSTEPESNATLNTGTVGLSTAAASAPAGHENMQPYLALNYCIALDGVYPVAD